MKTHFWKPLLLTTMSLTLALFTFLAFAPAKTAQADSIPPDRITITQGTDYTTAKLMLHVFTMDGHDHTWAEVKWKDPTFQGCVWMDQSTNPSVDANGAHLNYTSFLGRMCGNGDVSAHNSPELYDGPGTWVRACADKPDKPALICTSWN